MIGGQTCMQKIEHKAVVVVIMATAFLFTFSQFLLITAYPTIMDEFGVNATQVQWLTTAFLLTTIVFIPMTGYLSNTYKAKTLVVFSLSCLVIGMIIGGYSPNFGTLILSRVIQAVGAGIRLPLVQTILLKVFPYERRMICDGAFRRSRQCRTRFSSLPFRYRHRLFGMAFTSLDAASDCGDRAHPWLLLK